MYDMQIHNVGERKRRLVDVWSGLQQSVVDSAVSSVGIDGGVGGVEPPQLLMLTPQLLVQICGGGVGTNPPPVSFVVNGKLESRMSVRATSVIAVECKELRTCFRGFRKFGEETRVWRTMNAKKFYSFWGRVN